MVKYVQGNVPSLVEESVYLNSSGKIEQSRLKSPFLSSSGIVGTTESKTWPFASFILRDRLYSK